MPLHSRFLYRFTCLYFIIQEKSFRIRNIFSLSSNVWVHEATCVVPPMATWVKSIFKMNMNYFLQKWVSFKTLLCASMATGSSRSGQAVSANAFGVQDSTYEKRNLRVGWSQAASEQVSFTVYVAGVTDSELQWSDFMKSKTVSLYKKTKQKALPYSRLTQGFLAF